MKRRLLGPETVVAPFVENACWAFEGSNGTLTIKLRQRAVIGSVSLQQTNAELSFFLKQAPKNVDVLDATSGQLLGSFVSLAEQSFQTFELAKPKEVDALTFVFKSNHGSAEFTCVGKIRIHSK